MDSHGFILVQDQAGKFPVLVSNYRTQQRHTDTFASHYKTAAISRMITQPLPPCICSIKIGDSVLRLKRFVHRSFKSNYVKVLSYPEVQQLEPRSGLHFVPGLGGYDSIFAIAGCDKTSPDCRQNDEEFEHPLFVHDRHYPTVESSTQQDC